MNSPIASIASDVQNKTSTAVQQVKQAVARALENKSYNALISLQEEAALKKAARIDEAITKGNPAGRLTGVPFVVKDNFLILETPTTAASKILKDFTAPLTATAIEKLEQEGAICIGKANLDAFGNGGSTENSAYGPTKNAFDQTRVAGGSSGGSAVALALDIVPFALGTDTGGSIRQPAGFNGVVGIKPTYGTVSRFGVVAMASSFDCIGPMAHTAADTELLLDVMAGRDNRDSTTLPDFFAPLQTPLKNQKIGLIKELASTGVDTDVTQKLQDYSSALQQAGHMVEEVSIPTLKYSLAMYYIIMPAEVMSNLSRYDGIRYGKRENNQNLASLYAQTRDKGFETENERRILIGSYVLSSGYVDAYYNQAQKARTLLIRDFNEAFKKFDMLISPVSPSPAFKLGEKVNDPIKMYLADVMTVSANLAGLPAISVPAGKTSSGLPVGVQLIGPQKSDALILGIAKSMEKKV